MLQEKLRQDLNSVYFSGQTLNLEEQMNINLSLLKLHENENFDQVNFWGKIRGVYKDYYIAQTLNFKGHSEFPHIRFFWCTAQTWLFAELPHFTPGDERYISRFNSAFSGEHDRVLVEAPPTLPSDADSLATPEGQIASKNFTELDRLAVVVRSIDQDCQVVPRGAYKMNTSYELSPNSEFKGLRRDQVGQIEFYHHFRKVQFPEKREMIDRDDALDQLDFLDNIDRDSPRGCWSLQVDTSGMLAVLRSLLWPGYVGYHRASTDKFGGLYFGDGIKNIDLPFML